MVDAATSCAELEVMSPIIDLEVPSVVYTSTIDQRYMTKRRRIKKKSPQKSLLLRPELDLSLFDAPQKKAIKVKQHNFGFVQSSPLKSTKSTASFKSNGDYCMPATFKQKITRTKNLRTISSEQKITIHSRIKPAKIVNIKPKTPFMKERHISIPVTDSFERETSLPQKIIAFLNKKGKSISIDSYRSSSMSPSTAHRNSRLDHPVYQSQPNFNLIRHNSQERKQYQQLNNRSYSNYYQ